LKIKRIVSNVETSDVEKAKAFYHDILGLRLVMDHGWIRTYGSNSKICGLTNMQPTHQSVIDLSSHADGPEPLSPIWT
jgi:catechol 2,3-dioxygenase-like lactoylglutathione lyase family enzyme